MKKTRKQRSEEIFFTKEDYNSGEGFMTSVWGPPLWHVLHTISFNYPVAPSVEQKKQYYHFIWHLQDILPCKYCRINLAKNFKSLPLTMKDMESRSTFSLYIYRLHEVVNQMLGKKSGLTYEEVRDRYEHFRARGCSQKKRDKTKKKRELGCVRPLHGKKTKCVLKIVPQDDDEESFQDLTSS